MAAQMIPDYCLHNEEDKEYLIYDALKKLPEGYIVIHNFRVLYIERKKQIEHECDFMVFHPKKGFLCIEAKSGNNIHFSNGSWYYSNGTPMNPFTQVSNVTHTLMDYINFVRPIPNCLNIQTKCKFVQAVWFHEMDNRIKDPAYRTSQSDPSIILTKEDLNNPEAAIERIYNNVKWSKDETNLNNAESDALIKKILNCQYDFVSSYSDVNREHRFIQLLDEQVMCLNFMKNEKLVTVIGGAGTGKTVLAQKQAQNLATKGDNVLFMCFNRFLRDKLDLEAQEFINNHNINGKIFVYDLDEFVTKIAHVPGNYNKAANIIGDLWLNGEFLELDGNKIQHVIIDEGQDFGRDDIERSNLLENLQLLVTRKENKGSFAAFFDKKQYIQGLENNSKLPKIMENSFCRIPLKTNCRNTRQIAKTSIGAIVEKEVKYESEDFLVLNEVAGKNPRIHICDKAKINECVRKIISSYTEDEKLVPRVTRNDIVILTLKSESESVLKDSLNDGKFDRCLFTSVRKFKGLESKIVILVDLDENEFHTETGMNNFYVGSSRARLYLNVVTSMSDAAIKNVLIQDFHKSQIEIDDDDPKQMLFGDIMQAIF